MDDGFIASHSIYFDEVIFKISSKWKWYEIENIWKLIEQTISEIKINPNNNIRNISIWIVIFPSHAYKK